MSNGTMPPIVRITAEQLAYLIDSIRHDDFTLDDKKKWVAQNTVIPLAGGVLVPVLNIDKTRKVIYVSALTAQVYLYPGNGQAQPGGIVIPVNQQLTTVLSYDTFGYPVTQNWSAFSTAAASVSIFEVIGPPSMG